MACCVIAAYLMGLVLRPLRRAFPKNRRNDSPHPRLPGPSSPSGVEASLQRS
jgi:hypothetical protein